MLARFCCVFAIALAFVLAGCGGKEEVKKNEGTIVNVAPTAEGAPAGGIAPSGAPATNQPLPPPPIPKINE